MCKHASAWVIKIKKKQQTNMTFVSILGLHLEDCIDSWGILV